VGSIPTFGTTRRGYNVDGDLSESRDKQDAIREAWPGLMPPLGRLRVLSVASPYTMNVAPAR